MRLPIRDAPPALTVGVSYRELFENGAFAQRELIPDNQLAGMARERGLAHWIGQEAPETADQQGSLSPIVFARTVYSTGLAVPAEACENVVFREEEEPTQWSEYAWDAWGHPQVSPLYSPWQLLYLDVVAREASVELPIDLVLAGDELAERLTPARGLLEAQRGILEDIDAAWRPLIKVLLVAQNVYWPRVRGRVTIVPSGSGAALVEAGRTSEDAGDLLQRAGCSVDQLAAAYYFLVERGLRREPHDGMVMLRRSVPREYHVRWRGNVRQAQDHFDAAQMLRLWLTDLTGHAPGAPESWPLDGRQADRMALYERGPALRVMDEELKRELISIELYPHGPLVIGEGASERIVIDWLLQALLGLRGAFRFHDLEGGGGAIRISQLLESFEGYPAEAFVVADNEGDTKRYVTAAIADGKIDKDNVLLAEDSIEHDNFTLNELIEVAQELAAHPPEGREPVSFELTADRLRDEHMSRRDRRPRDKPGIADTLLDLIERPEYGTVRISKPELAEGLARLLVGELSRADGREALLEVTERRPIVRFVLDRICPLLNPPRPAS